MLNNKIFSKINNKLLQHKAIIFLFTEIAHNHQKMRKPLSKEIPKSRESRDLYSRELWTKKNNCQTNKKVKREPRVTSLMTILPKSWTRFQTKLFWPEKLINTQIIIITIIIITCLKASFNNFNSPPVLSRWSKNLNILTNKMAILIIWRINSLNQIFIFKNKLLIIISAAAIKIHPRNTIWSHNFNNSHHNHQIRNYSLKKPSFNL